MTNDERRNEISRLGKLERKLGDGTKFALTLMFLLLAWIALTILTQ